MQRETIFAAWAPPRSIWHTWAKPVLFAHMPRMLPEPAAVVDESVPWAPPADGKTLLVIDLPGVKSVWAGLALAAIGYRPVPLFNAAPGPMGLASTAPDPPMELVDVRSILHALSTAAVPLSAINLDDAAPPAFLLDADRRFGRRGGRPRDFDNRSISFPTDFPSSNLLVARGINHVILVQSTAAPPQEDLAHALRRWQEAKMQLFQVALDAPTPRPQPLEVRRPRQFQVMWHNLVAAMGFRRSPLGGFGGLLPDPSAG